MGFPKCYQVSKPIKLGCASFVPRAGLANAWTNREPS